MSDKIDNVDWDIYHSIKKTVVDNLIKDLQNIELPPEWRPKDVLYFVRRKLEDQNKSC